jgi:hypothetical protein
LITTEVVDVEDEILRKIFRASPDSPAHASICETILVARDVDRYHTGQTEIPTKSKRTKVSRVQIQNNHHLPFQVRVNERCYKTTTTKAISIQDNM